MKRRYWTPEEMATVRSRYPHERTDAIARDLGRTESQIYQCAARLGLTKSPEYLASPEACRLRRGGNIGAATRFQKGQTPQNKGVRRPGWAPGRMATTQFKPGALSGQAAKLLVPVGTEVRDTDGYLKRKVRDDAPPNQSRFNWAFVHVLVWTEKNGLIPDGHAVVFRNGDRADIRLDNLELVSRTELMRRNSYHNRYPKEIGLAIQLRGQIVRQINKRVRREKQD